MDDVPRTPSDQETSPASSIRPVVLVCGEPERGDDGAAYAAVASLPRAIASRATILRVGLLEADHLLDVPAGAACIVLDAAVGVTPGEVIVVALAAIADRSGRGAPRSSHTMPPDQAIGLAAALAGRPPSGVFIGIGGEAFTPGAGLSPAVRSGLPRLVEVLAREIVEMAAPDGPDLSVP